MNHPVQMCFWFWQEQQMLGLLPWGRGAACETGERWVWSEGGWSSGSQSSSAYGARCPRWASRAGFRPVSPALRLWKWFILFYNKHPANLEQLTTFRERKERVPTSFGLPVPKEAKQLEQQLLLNDDREAARRHHEVLEKASGLYHHQSSSRGRTWRTVELDVVLPQVKVSSSLKINKRADFGAGTSLIHKDSGMEQRWPTDFSN